MQSAIPARTRRAAERGRAAGRLRLAPARRLLALGAALLLGSGCAGFWQQVQEQRSRQSWSRASELVRAGRCEEALASIERAQIAPTLTRAFAARSTFAKAECLSRLGRGEEALAHYRFVRDFLPESPEARALAERLAGDEVGGFGADDASAQITSLPAARYPREARTQGITGRVSVAWSAGADGRTTRIRVTSETHPLLASWAIESVARAELAAIAPVDASSPGAPRSDLVFRFLGRKDAVVEG